MTNEQLNQALFECYTEMKHRHSNIELGLGNGKNISIAKLSDDKYIIRNGRKDIISYKLQDDDVYYNMTAKHIIVDQLPIKFYINELVPSRSIQPGYDLHSIHIEIDHELTEIPFNEITYIKQEFIDKHFIYNSYQNPIDNGYLYKLEIDEKLIKHIIYNDTSRILKFEFYTESGDYIQGYTAPYCYYSIENPNVIFTNSIVRLIAATVSSHNYIERYVDKQSIVHRSILQGNAKSIFTNALSSMTNDQITDLIDQLKKINN